MPSTPRSPSSTTLSEGTARSPSGRSRAPTVQWRSAGRCRATVRLLLASEVHDISLHGERELGSRVTGRGTPSRSLRDWGEQVALCLVLRVCGVLCHNGPSSGHRIGETASGGLRRRSDNAMLDSGLMEPPRSVDRNRGVRAFAPLLLRRFSASGSVPSNRAAPDRRPRRRSSQPPLAHRLLAEIARSPRHEEEEGRRWPRTSRRGPASTWRKAPERMPSSTMPPPPATARAEAAIQRSAWRPRSRRICPMIMRGRWRRSLQGQDRLPDHPADLLLEGPLAPGCRSRAPGAARQGSSSAADSSPSLLPK